MEHCGILFGDLRPTAICEYYGILLCVLLSVNIMLFYFATLGRLSGIIVVYFADYGRLSGIIMVYRSLLSVPNSFLFPSNYTYELAKVFFMAFFNNRQQSLTRLPLANVGFFFFFYLVFFSSESVGIAIRISSGFGRRTNF